MQYAQRYSSECDFTGHDEYSDGHCFTYGCAMVAIQQKCIKCGSDVPHEEPRGTLGYSIFELISGIGRGKICNRSFVYCGWRFDVHGG